jgi:hypothetical protein
VLAVGRNILEIAYHLLSEQTIYRELGIDYFDRYRAERLKRRSLAQLQRLGYQVSLTPLPTAAYGGFIFRTGTPVSPNADPQALLISTIPALIFEWLRSIIFPTFGAGFQRSSG